MRDAEAGFAAGTMLGGTPIIRFGDPSDGSRPGFDPVWGTLGGPASSDGANWLARPDEQPGGMAVDVEIFGTGFQISGADPDRPVRSALGLAEHADRLHPGPRSQPRPPRPDERSEARAPHGTLWIRLDQIVLVAERNPAQASRPGAPVVQKQRRTVSIVTPGYNLRGSIHVHAYGSMKQFLESPDPHFLPITDVTVRWLVRRRHGRALPVRDGQPRAAGDGPRRTRTPAGDSASGQRRRRGGRRIARAQAGRRLSPRTRSAEAGVLARPLAAARPCSAPTG